MNSKGFSLIEVLVSAGILGVVILGVMRVNDHLWQVERRFEEASDILEITNNLKLYLGHQLTCMGTLSQAKEESGPGEFAIPLSGTLPGILNFKGREYLSSFKPFGKIQIEEISFSPHEGHFTEDQFERERGLLDLKIHIRGSGKSITNRYKIIPLWVYASKIKQQEAKILYCDSEKNDITNQITIAVMNQVCSSFEARYDYKKERCLFSNDHEGKIKKDMFQKTLSESQKSPQNIRMQAGDMDLEKIDINSMNKIFEMLIKSTQEPSQ
ncbi:MAG: prepilin-type N-terminal cleavage/methylation domain-containing protein [Halobacteriovoraceae bacterium]|nr:prepilin-type N-terminal cleavage/methylation domain-containing protein [Halobacteriovoraceae bacterium]